MFRQLIVFQAVNNDEEEHERSESEEEQIFVTREEEKIDPEAEADFDRAFESMMNDSMQSRKFERKTLFDVPLPMRRAPVRESTPGVPEETDNQHEQIATSPPKTMAFSLMTKRGNRQQVGISYGNSNNAHTSRLVPSIFRQTPISLSQ